MRSFSFLSFLLIPGLLSAAACSVTAPGQSFQAGAPPVVNTTASMDGGDAAPTASPEEDGGGDAFAAPLQQNNVLCVVTTTCDPDSPETASSCHVAPDGGAYDPSAGYGGDTLACRVQPASSIASDGVGLPTACSVAGPGTAGETCTEATDCAAAFDCVGMGTCRHYCCAGNGQCGAQEFCDIQPLAAATTTKVPVCMPIVIPGCSLRSELPDAPASATPACSKGQTCAIVREDGTTGCVEAGGKAAGEPCNTDHCADGLVCLGALNARLCYALCSTSASGACPSPMTCQGGLPLFQDPTVGVCR
jgi:hypothetical protein